MPSGQAALSSCAALDRSRSALPDRAQNPPRISCRKMLVGAVERAKIDRCRWPSLTGYFSGTADMDPSRVHNLPLDLVRTMTLPNTATRRLLFLFVVVVSFLCNPAAAWDEPASTRSGSASLAGRIEPLIQAHKGKVAVAVKNLKTGESFQYQADVSMPTASLIKFPVMIEAYRQAAAGQVNLDGMVTLKNGIKVPGSGMLTYHFSAGSTLPAARRGSADDRLLRQHGHKHGPRRDRLGLDGGHDGVDGLSPTPRSIPRSFTARPRSFPSGASSSAWAAPPAVEMVWLCEALRPASW